MDYYLAGEANSNKPISLTTWLGVNPLDPFLPYYRSFSVTTWYFVYV